MWVCLSICRSAEQPSQRTLPTKGKHTRAAQLSNTQRRHHQQQQERFAIRQSMHTHSTSGGGARVTCMCDAACHNKMWIDRVVYVSVATSRRCVHTDIAPHKAKRAFLCTHARGRNNNSRFLPAAFLHERTSSPTPHSKQMCAHPLPVAFKANDDGVDGDAAVVVDMAPTEQPQLTAGAPELLVSWIFTPPSESFAILPVAVYLSHTHMHTGTCSCVMPNEAISFVRARRGGLARVAPSTDMYGWTHVRHQTPTPATVPHVCVCVYACAHTARARTHKHTHAQTHTHTHARAHTLTIWYERRSVRARV